MAKSKQDGEFKTPEALQPLPFEGIVHVTGEQDTGKSALALSVPNQQPRDYIVFDWDIKTEPIAEAFAKQSTPFGYYINLVKAVAEEGADSPLEQWKFINKKLDEAAAKVPNARVFIFDNFTPMEAAIRAYSMTIMPKISGLSQGQIQNMSRMTWPFTYSGVYEPFLDRLRSMAPLVFIITHIKEKYMSPGVLVTKGQKPITEKSNIRFWLRLSATGPYPTILVLKRPMRMMVTPEGIKPVNILPRKIAQGDWGTILRYLNDPMGNRAPLKEETLTEFEQSIVGGFLTADQKEALRLQRKLVERGEMSEEEAEFAENASDEKDATTLKIESLLSEGKSPKEISDELSDDETTVTIPQVLKVKKALKE